MKETSDLVFMASYHAAISYIKYRKRSNNDLIIVDPTLWLFGEYFSTYTSCYVLAEFSNRKECLSLLKRLKINSLSYWGYGLSELGIFVANFAKTRQIPTEIVLPTDFTDELYKSKQFNLSSALKCPKSLIQIIIKKILGYPIKMKTYNGRLFDCIDTGFVQSVKTYRETIKNTEYSDFQFSIFVDFIKAKYANIIEDICSQPKPVIILDEDPHYLYMSMGLQPAQNRRLIGEIFEKLTVEKYTVNLKPNYYGDIFHSGVHSFDNIIPGEIPLEALDILLPPNTIVTGFSSSFLKTKTKNLKPIQIYQLLDLLDRIGNCCRYYKTV